MASTFTDLGIEKMATGENAGTWGDKTNTNLEIVEKAIAGYVEKAITSGGTTALTIQDGDSTESTSVARHAVIKLTGTISGNSIVTVPDSIEKVYIVTNGTSGAYTVQFKTASGSGITFGVSEKTTRLVYSDGTNIVDAGFSGASDMEGRELVLDADGDTSITADTDDQIDIKIAGTDQLTIKDGALSPVTTNDIDLGTASLEFKDAFFDGTVTADAFAGPLTGNVTGNASGTAATVTTAAQSNITSLGTLTTLTVDNVIINGSTIGHTGDTDLITVASGIATVAGEVSMTTLDIGGTNVTSTAAELNLLDGGTSATSTTVADADRVVLNDNGTMVQVAVTDLAAYFDDEITAMPNLVTTAATTVGALDSGSITSGFGTIDTGSSTITTTGLISGGSLDIDNVLINGTTIGHTDDTDLLTVADGLLTVAGEVSMTTLDIGGTNVTSTAAELNLLDTKDATHLAVPGKIEGTNFTDSLLVGHATHGTLNAAEDNTGIGIAALDALTSGDGNTAVGSDAGSAINSGIRNTTIGAIAGKLITTSQQNTAVGYSSLTANISGDKNTAIGAFSLNAVTGGFNIGVGKGAGANITSGSGNVIIGADIDAAAVDSARTLKIAGNDGSTTTTWITGDSSGNLTFAADVTVGDDLNLTTDSAVINFGADSDTILTHTDGTGLTLNSTNKLCFNDATQFVQGSSGTVLSLGATDEIDLTATAIDINGTCDISGTFSLAGTNVTSTAAELNKLDGVGTLKEAGKETIWIPSNAMTPTTSNGAARATVETTSGRPDMEVLDFDKDSDEFAQFAVAFPKSYNLGTITFQCFWSGLAATTGVAISLQGVAMNDNETIDVAYGTAVVVTDDAQGAVEELLVTAESGAVTIAGTVADNDLCYFRVGRDVSDGNDDMAGDMRLHGIKIFFTTDAANDA